MHQPRIATLMLDLTLDQLEEITNNAGPIDGNDGYLLVSFERFN
jgi:hypothetical protein